MKNKVAAISFLAFLSLSPYAWADSINTVSIGGITTDSSPQLSLNKETLNVSWRQVLADYEFENTSKSTISKSMKFVLPAYPANIEVANQYFGEPQNLSITVNNKPVNYQANVKALFNNKDVTPLLKKAGLSLEQIAYFPSYSPFEQEVAPLNEQQIKQLKSLKLLTNDTPDGGFAPAWLVQVTYQWKQNFKPGEKINMQHSYTPFSGVGDEIDKKPEDGKYCGNIDFSASWDKLALNQNGYKYLSAATVSYNPNNSIAKDFTLNIEQSPDELVSACLPENARDLKNGILELRMKNSQLKEPLNIYFGNIEDLEPQIGKAPKIK